MAQHIKQRSFNAMQREIYQAVLVCAAQLAQHHDHLDVLDVLVPAAVVGQRAAWEHVTPNSYACTTKTTQPLPLHTSENPS